MAWEVAVRGRTYEKIYRRNCNLLYTAFYVLHFAAVCGPNRWYGDGRFNSVRDPDPVHFAWQYFQKQNKICYMFIRRQRQQPFCPLYFFTIMGRQLYMQSGTLS